MTRHERVDAHPAPTSPWVISTRELGRRAGAMRTYQRTIPAPAGFSLGLIGIPEGAPIELDLRLEAASEGVFVSGTARAELVGECSRCLEPIADRVEARLGELFAYPDSATEATTDADEVSRVVDEMIDTEPMVRDAVLLGLPLAPLCQEDCRGLCPDCGERWADLDASHGHETLDPRWAALRGRLASATETAPDGDGSR
ncbi:YceD family protein [Pseudonocardia acaciae]|uniref:YceD family protein n=1 Tax=Pseudonocardia acaciae TaxID=551276 RepID=UPI00048E396C|nr:YceD family protein [Pseudonocardia acaciae]